MSNIEDAIKASIMYSAVIKAILHEEQKTLCEELKQDNSISETEKKKKLDLFSKVYDKTPDFIFNKEEYEAILSRKKFFDVCWIVHTEIKELEIEDVMEIAAERIADGKYPLEV